MTRSAGSAIDRAQSSVNLSLVITTYERPDALAAVLASVGAQHTMPSEVIVADDGSAGSTAAVIASWTTRLPCPLLHCYQLKQGFRLTRLRNMATAATMGDYLLFVDGDMILHPDFIGDHALLARRGYFTQGVRVLMSAELTARLLQRAAVTGGVQIPRFHNSGLGGLRRLYLLRSLTLARCLRTIGNRCIAIKGCNQGFWRSDLLRVNGFDEAIEGWGPEDKELCARLTHAGVRRQSLLAGGIAFHLAHPPAERSQLASNRGVLAATLATGRIRCERGLDGHLR